MIIAKKHLGQHFLTDKNIANKIASSLINQQKLPVMEIGPGTGILTTELIKINNKLTLVEIDTDSVNYLKQNFNNNEFRLLHKDFLKINFKDYFDDELCIIGNFPYNISSQILFKLLDNRELIPELCGMFQKEVAERIVANHGNKTYGILSVLLQLFYKIEYLFTVNENVFLPPPKVKSAVIRLTRYRKNIPDIDEKKLFLVIKTAFNQRRKTLRNSLRGILNTEQNTEHNFFSLRPEQLSPEDFIELLSILCN